MKVQVGHRIGLSLLEELYLLRIENPLSYAQILIYIMGQSKVISTKVMLRNSLEIADKADQS